MCLKVNKYANLLFLFLIQWLRENSSVKFKNDTDQIYYNPWSGIRKKQPKLVMFNANGDFFEKPLPVEHLIGIKKLREAFPKINELKYFLRNQTLEMLSSSTTSTTEQSSRKDKMPTKRIKVLTYCSKNSAGCRMLTCPNIKEYCMICEVTIKNNEAQNTYCEKVSTKYLYLNKNFVSL